jgi:hypothetical protein
MVLGFNHNIRYRGEVFHVQTEDSGVEIPNIVTLLYRGGVILCSMKTSYADILKMDNLADVVEELMKEQHKTMMRRLKSGEFDERAFPSAPPPPRGEKPEDTDAAPPLPSPGSGEEAPQADQAPLPREDGRHSTPEPASDGGGASDESRSLEDAILRFFGIHET